MDAQTPRHSPADLQAIEAAFHRTSSCKIPSCLYTHHIMRGALKGAFPESPVFVFHRDLTDGSAVWMTVRIIKYIPPELTIETDSKEHNFEKHQGRLDELFNEVHERFPELLGGLRILLIGQKPLQDVYETYINTVQQGSHTTRNFPTYLYYMTPEQQEKVTQMDLSLPEGYFFDKPNPEIDAPIITKTWIHAKKGDLEQTRAKLINLPSALIRYKDQGAVAFEMCHPCEFQNHLFVLPEHRRKGLGNAVEMRLSQLCLENNIVPFKTIEFYNESVIASCNKNSIWTRWNYKDGSPVHCEYKIYYSKKVSSSL
ncbi:hypothetical protein L596_019503 [Steinernema carpocapsae]|uniref:Glycine N-acyltransferase-like protein n=1 Tax=Steinernema carpocapsae TaxID=34508 RepID=A0A4V6A0Q4_STECR|nr:hypothetical protein L596_019503 [Steinernema carpocapsae]